MSNFLISFGVFREFAHVTSNKEVQWFKEEFKKEQDELERDMKVRFKEKQKQ